MHIESTEVLWFEQHLLSLSELAELSGLPPTVLEELLDCGAIAPLRVRRLRGSRFGAAALRAARTARRLRSDFELDVQALVAGVEPAGSGRRNSRRSCASCGRSCRSGTLPTKLAEAQRRSGFQR